MKILLSAYACEPNRGSEPGVGWGWAIELAKHHEVWVITRDNNAPVIQKYLKEHPEYKNERLHFEYVGVSKKMTFWKKGNKGIRLYYWMWQKNAYRAAKKLCSKVAFDYVQHVTFVSYTQPTYMYKLGLPLIWGPVSGGENIPEPIKLKYTMKEWIKEYVRKLSQYTAFMDASIIGTMNNATAIIAATEETKAKIPETYQGKTYLLPAIGLESLPEPKSNEKNDVVRIIMAGRLINWKAFDMGIRAFMKVSEKHDNVYLHILGEGDKKNYLKTLCGDLLDTKVFFEKPVKHDEIIDYYKGFDLFVNTTLRDSGCMALMEAMGAGLPCMAIATGGPKILLERVPSGYIVPESYDNTVNELSDMMERFISDSGYREKIQNECGAARKALTYEAHCKVLHDILSEVGIG